MAKWKQISILAFTPLSIEASLAAITFFSSWVSPTTDSQSGFHSILNCSSVGTYFHPWHTFTNISFMFLSPRSICTSHIAKWTHQSRPQSQHRRNCVDKLIHSCIIVHSEQVCVVVCALGLNLIPSHIYMKKVVLMEESMWRKSETLRGFFLLSSPLNIYYGYK